MRKDLTYKLKTIKYCYIFSYVTALNQSKFNLSYHTSIFLLNLGQLNSKEYSIVISVARQHHLSMVHKSNLKRSSITYWESLQLLWLMSLRYMHLVFNTITANHTKGLSYTRCWSTLICTGCIFDLSYFPRVTPKCLQAKVSLNQLYIRTETKKWQTKTKQ